LAVRDESFYRPGTHLIEVGKRVSRAASGNGIDDGGLGATGHAQTGDEKELAKQVHVFSFIN